METTAIGRALCFAGFETKAIPEKPIIQNTPFSPATKSQIELIEKKFLKKGILYEPQVRYLQKSYRVDNLYKLTKVQA